MWRLKRIRHGNVTIMGVSYVVKGVREQVINDLCVIIL